MQNARRKKCGKTTTNSRVDAAVIHSLLEAPLGTLEQASEGERGTETRKASKESGGAWQTGAISKKLTEAMTLPGASDGEREGGRERAGCLFGDAGHPRATDGGNEG